MEEDINSTFRILVATDNHLGYKETDPIIGNDSFQSFENILKIARELKVDFLLLGGDLFDANKPSKNTLNKTIELLNKYCLGSGNIEFTCIPTDDSPMACLPVNYEDENVNIALPIFVIHGNHDDPTRDGSKVEALSPLDVLSATRLVNYFARVPNIEDIQVKPILLQKGDTHLLMYGMGFVPDERLSRMFEQHRVTFYQPPDDEDWFHLFLIHQNCESGRNSRKMRLDLLPRFLQLVIWGHEHECKIDPLWSDEGQFYTMQPGSSCITSLIEAEAVPKKIALLEVNGKHFRVKPVILPDMRKFIFRNFTLCSYEQLDASSPTVTADIEAIFDEIMTEILDNNRNEEKLPLVRLAVDVTGFPSIPVQVYGAKYVGKIANTDSLLNFRRKNAYVGPRSTGDTMEAESVQDIFNRSSHYETMVTLIEQNLEKVGGLNLFDNRHMEAALNQYVNKGCSTSFDVTVDHFDTIYERMIQSLDISGADPDSVVKVIKDEYDKDGVDYLKTLVRDIYDEDEHGEDGEESESVMDEEPSAKRKPAQKKRTAASKKLFVSSVLS